MSNTDSATSLEIDSILNQASDDAGGLTDFGQLPFKEPLAKVLASLEEEAIDAALSLLECLRFWPKLAASHRGSLLR